MPGRYDHLKLDEHEIQERALGIALSGSTFRAVADFTYDWESWHRPDGKVVWVNLAVERMTGYFPRECLKMEDYPLPMVVAEDRGIISEVIDLAINRGSGNDIEFRVAHRDGRIFTMAVSYQPMYDGSRQYLGFRTSVRDITERCEMREKIQQYAESLENLVEQRTAQLRNSEAQRSKMERLAAMGQLSARVAHEVNNPLAGIRNAFELIKQDLPPQHKHFRLLNLIDSEIERISSIMQQMFQLYRRNPQQSIHFDLIKTIESVLTLLSGFSRQHGVSLRFLQADKAESIFVCLPEGEVKQVLYNLLINAIQASESGQEVTISASQQNQEIWLDVVDQGAGIDPAILPEIFDPFFSTKGDSGRSGMGLGLSVSRSLIESMHGRLEVQTALGQGSIFRVVLPMGTT
jgi:PAS domain S-box-containing protein